MRLRLRFLVLLVVVSACLTQSSGLQTWLRTAARLGSGRARKPVTLSHTYVLNETAWLDFPLPPASQLVWVLTNANFASSSLSSDRATPWRPGVIYAMQYRFLNARNEVLQSGTFHFRAQLPDAPPLSDLRAFYAAEGLLPGIGQSMRQRLASLQPRPSRLRLRLGVHDDRIQDVSVRVYCQNELPEYKLAHAWRRTSQSKREKLCSASVYGPDLLTDYEQRNLIKRRWLPVAPSGLEGRDYARRILYSYITDEMNQSNEAEYPAGLLVHRGMAGVIPLPSGPGRVRLELTRVGDKTSAADIDVRWFGRRAEQRDHWRMQAISDGHDLETELDGGQLEIVATGDFAARAFWRSGDAPAEADYEEITARPNSVRAYVVGPQQAVEYAIEHVGDRPTPMKLAIRQLMPAQPNAISSDGTRQVVRVDWCFMGAGSEVIRNGHFDAREALSQYDRIGGEDRMPVTDAAVLYFAVPPGVRMVRLQSPDVGVVVNAYTRPKDVTGVTFVPEDYSAFHRKQGWRSSWFLMRPVNHLQRINELQAVTILTQPRPRDVDEQRLAGHYQWESFQPSGRWKGRHLLLPRAARFPLRWESLGSAFFELQTGVDYDLPLLGEPGHRWVSPRLVCQTSTLPVDVRVYVNDRLHQQLRLRSRLAELVLDALPAREDETTCLRIEADSEVRVLMNRIEHAAAETVFFKRIVSRIEGRALEFDYEKLSPDEELLGLTLFHTASEQRARLSVRIVGDVFRAPGPNPDWTVLDRVYELQPTTSHETLMFAADAERVFEQHQCFLRLGSDLPPGKYTIEVTREDDETGYLLLSKTSSGLSARRALATETEPSSTIETNQNRRT